MKRISTYAAIFAAALLWTTSVNAQSPAPASAAAASSKSDAAPATVRVSGVVRTANGTAVPGASVRLLHVESGQAWVSWTGEDGKFAIAGLPAGHYRFEARQLGLGTASREAELRADATAELEFTLGKSKPAENPPLESSSKPAADTSDKAAKSAASGPESLEPAAATRKHHGGRPATESADANLRKKPRAGFEQVTPSGQPTASAESVADASGTAAADSNPLAQNSSSDAFLINGTVGRSASIQGLDPNGEQPDDASAKDSGKAQGRHGRGNRKTQNASAGDNLGEGLDALSARDRVGRIRSNRIRLSFYNIYDNSAWDARPHSLRGGTPAKISRYSEKFGTHLGGPLVIPHVYDGRERTFFFASYELNRHRNPFDVFETVPTAAERQGDFSDRGAQLFDPLSNLNGARTSLGSAIPASRLDPAVVRLVQLIPLPNLPGLVQNFHRQTVLPQSTDQVNVRVLHTLSPRFNVQAIYNLLQADGQNGASFPSLGSTQSVRDQSVTLGLTQNWTPRLLNETRLNWNRSRIQTLNRFAFHENLAGELGITGISTAPIDFGPPTILMTNFTEINDAVPLKERNETFRLMDNISYTLSRHTLRAGAEIRRRHLNLFTDPTPRGEFTFTGLLTSQLDAQGQVVDGTGLDFADFLLGLPETTSLRFGNASNYGRSWWFVSYFQDDWRVHPRFSVNWGVRYELITPLREKFNHIANLDLNSNITALAVVLPGQVAPFSGALPPALIRTDKNNWAPRIGIAWRPFKHNLVVRTGYGLFYNGSIYDQLFASVLDQSPFAQVQTTLTSASRVLTLTHGFPPQSPDVVPNTVAIDPNYRVGYAQIWNLSMETPLTTSLIVELNYTGTKGTHLDLLRAPNRATPGSLIGADQRRRIPNAQDFDYETFGADSIYHGLQVRVQRRMAHGLRLLFLYTYGKSIDNASSIGVGNRSGVVQDDRNFAAERGLSIFDQRHQFRTWYSYELPFGERKQWLHGGWLATVFGNWTVSGNTTVSSGTHFTARLSGSDVNGTGAIFSQRPDAIGNPNLAPGVPQTPSHFFNTAAFALPPVGRFGNAARNTITGPGLLTVNFALARRMHFGKDDRYRLDCRWEVQNLLNTVNFTGLSTVVDSSQFGRVMGARPMRTMDLVMRVHF